MVDALSPIREVYDPERQLSDEELVERCVSDLRLIQEEAARYVVIESFVLGHGPLSGALGGAARSSCSGRFGRFLLCLGLVALFVFLLWVSGFASHGWPIF